MRSTNKLRIRQEHARRRGALYIAVLGVTMLVAMMSLAAMHVVRMNFKAATGKGELYEASVLAASAIENAMIVLRNDPFWRTSHQSGMQYPSTAVSLGDGSFTWKLVDEDGNLADDPSDGVLLQGIGRVGGKTHVEQVRLQPSGTGMNCLEASLHCQGSLNSWFGADVMTNQMVSTNGDIWFTGGAQITGNAEAVGYISAVVSGSETPYTTPRQMPGSKVFDYYVNLGTQIDMAALRSGPTYFLRDVVLSPQSNPFRSPNPDGIYVLDCKGLELTILKTRVVGTLVVLNPHPISTIESQILLEPSVTNYPTLMVSGSIQFAYDSTKNLVETTVNFNPPGTPYQGVEDSDLLDIYPSVIKGLVYVSGFLNLAPDLVPSAVEGVVVCNAIGINSDLNLTYQSRFLQYPPPGFATGSSMEILPGTWTRARSP